MNIDWAFKYENGDILEDKDRVRYRFVSAYYCKDKLQTYYEFRLVAVPSVVFILDEKDVKRKLNRCIPYLAEGDFVICLRDSNTFDSFKEGEIVEIKNINSIAKVAVTADHRLISFERNKLVDKRDFVTISHKELELRRQFRSQKNEML